MNGRKLAQFVAGLIVGCVIASVGTASAWTNRRVEPGFCGTTTSGPLPQWSQYGSGTFYCGVSSFTPLRHYQVTAMGISIYDGNDSGNSASYNVLARACIYEDFGDGYVCGTYDYTTGYFWGFDTLNPGLGAWQDAGYHEAIPVIEVTTALHGTHGTGNTNVYYWTANDT
jgi:hypothetical protein